MNHRRKSAVALARAALAVTVTWGAPACLPKGETTTTKREREPKVVLEMSHGTPIARDDDGQPVLRVDVFEGDRSQVAVPYLYGYPLYSGQGGHVAVRKLRHENWDGYERQLREADDGIVHVREQFPALGCTFEGIQEGPQRYVPLSIECELPPPEALGGANRPVVGALKTGAPADKVRRDPSLTKAFLGQWHSTTPGFEGKNGTGYFATVDGLLGFGFERGGLKRLSFLFDPPQQAWRRPELWAPPAP